MAIVSLGLLFLELIFLMGECCRSTNPMSLSRTTTTELPDHALSTAAPTNNCQDISGPCLIGSDYLLMAIEGYNAELECQVNNIEHNRLDWVKKETKETIAIDHHLIAREIVQVHIQEVLKIHDRRYSIYITKDRRFSRLYIKNIRKSDAGTYMCRLNTSPMKYREINLTVSKHLPLLTSTSTPRSYEPTFVQESDGNKINAVEGGYLTLNCKINHLGQYKVAWIKLESNRILAIHTHKIIRDARFVISVQENRRFQLLISNLRISDGGTYVCQVNTDPMRQQTFHLNIIIPTTTTPRMSTTTPRMSTSSRSPCQETNYPCVSGSDRNVSVQQGETAVLECVIHTIPSWISPGGSLISLANFMVTKNPRFSASISNEIGYNPMIRNVTKGDKIFSASISNGSSYNLTIRNVTKGDNGIYICRVNALTKQYIHICLNVISSATTTPRACNPTSHLVHPEFWKVTESLLNSIG